MQFTLDSPKVFNEIFDKWTAGLTFIRKHNSTLKPIENFVEKLIDYNKSKEFKSIWEACEQNFYAHVLSTLSSGSVTKGEMAQGYKKQANEILSGALEKNDEEVSCTNSFTGEDEVSSSKMLFRLFRFRTFQFLIISTNTHFVLQYASTMRLLMTLTPRHSNSRKMISRLVNGTFLMLFMLLVITYLLVYVLTLDAKCFSFIPFLSASTGVRRVNDRKSRKNSIENR